jgi:hypothetical protein
VNLPDGTAICDGGCQTVLPDGGPAYAFVGVILDADAQARTVHLCLKTCTPKYLGTVLEAVGIVPISLDPVTATDDTGPENPPQPAADVRPESWEQRSAPMRDRG